MHPYFDHPVSPSALQQSFARLGTEGRRLRRREAARRLDCSEAELIDIQADCRRLRLNQNFPQLVERLHRLGYIMTLTRNDAAVHERQGHYPHAHIHRPIGLVIAADRKIDLRLIFSNWHQGFAVAELTPRGIRYSFQFFDARGSAIQKIFLLPDSNLDAYFELIKHFRAEEQNPPLTRLPAEPQSTEIEDHHIDPQALALDWSRLSDVHQFFGLLRKHKVSRQQAFRLVGSPWARAVDPGQLQPLLEQAARQELPLMCFVGNSGNIQIHSGAIRTVKPVHNWLNILDAEFNLHLDMNRIAAAWLVRKPSRDGVITSLELYTDNGDTAVQFFGVRQEGRPENPAWRRLAESILKPERACA